MPALGYASASAGTALDGPEIEAQRLEIESACQDLGLELVDLVRDHEPDEPGADGRPGLSYALERIDAGEASCLIVSDLERLSRQVPELAAVIDRLERARVRLIAIDVGLDTATPSGRLAVTRRREAAAADETAVEAQPEDEAAAETLEGALAARLVRPAPEPPSVEADTAGAPAEPVAPLQAGGAVRALGYASVPADAGARIWPRRTAPSSGQREASVSSSSRSSASGSRRAARPSTAPVSHT